MNHSFKNPFSHYARSHSEEPRQEETYPLEPRSSSENNVSPDSKERPNIIINQPSEQEKQDETWSSSVPTSSSERSPVISQVDSFMDSFSVLKGSKNEIETKCGNESSVNLLPEKLDRYIIEPKDRVSLVKDKCNQLPAHGTKMVEIASNNRDAFQSRKQTPLKPGNEHESDDRESGLGDLEVPKSNRDIWNLRKTKRCTRCSNLFISVSFIFIFDAVSGIYFFLIL